MTVSQEKSVLQRYYYKNTNEIIQIIVLQNKSFYFSIEGFL